MTIIRNSVTDPAFNLAAEEYLCEHASENCFMLWRNSPSVIFGRNQNPWAELDFDFIKEHGINAVRRMTGGGAVFHDLGNVNFSYIVTDDVRALDFTRFTGQITSALSLFGVEASADGRNDITAYGSKISGNAQLIRKRGDGRQIQLHHGTLLFSADMSSLSGALRVNSAKLKSKGIKSVRARVANISDFPSYIGPSSAEAFLSALESFAAEKYGAEPRQFTDAEIREINSLAEAKYRSWEWNFGKTPQFEAERTERTSAGTVTVMLDSVGGKIKNVRIFGDFFALGELEVLENALVGAPLTAEGITRALGAVDSSKIISGMTDSELARVIIG